MRTVLLNLSDEAFERLQSEARKSGRTLEFEATARLDRSVGLDESAAQSPFPPAVPELTVSSKFAAGRVSGHSATTGPELSAAPESRSEPVPPILEPLIPDSPTPGSPVEGHPRTAASSRSTIADLVEQHATHSVPRIPTP